MVFFIKNPIGVPVVTPSNIPDKNSTLSRSFLWVTIFDWPGFLLFKSFWIDSISMAIPAGQPSITPPIAEPCDSPKVVSVKIFPNEFDDR